MRLMNTKKLISKDSDEQGKAYAKRLMNKKKPKLKDTDEHEKRLSKD